MSQQNMLDEEELARQTQERLLAAKVKMSAAAKTPDMVAETPDTNVGSNVAGGVQAARQITTTAQTKGTGNSGADIGKGALTGAGTGAGIGTLILPGVGTAIGAGAGAVVGGVVGALSAKAAREQRARDAESKKFMDLAEIEQEKQRRISSALENMGSRMSASLNSPIIRI